MIAMPTLQAAYAVLLFAGYLILWRIKRARQRRQTGADPKVIDRATDPLQRFFRAVGKVLTATVVAILVTHGLGLGLPGTRSLPSLDLPALDHLGFATGVLGLLLCGIAQWTMGVSWREGIDEANRTELVTQGIYRLVRNPTYLGLFVVNLGLWLIWPTSLVSLFVLAFYLMLEVQVRCEEQHLLRLHGDAYRDYLARTWRYLPWIY